MRDDRLSVEFALVDFSRLTGQGSDARRMLRVAFGQHDRREGGRMDNKLELLSRVPLFSRCRGNALEELGRLADEIDVPAGATLTQEGKSGAEFFVLVDGRVRVEREGKVVGRLEPGDFFGEIALIDGGPRSATVVAEMPAKLLVIAHREFHTLLADFPGIRQAVFEALAQRVRNLEPGTID